MFLSYVLAVVNDWFLFSFLELIGLCFVFESLCYLSSTPLIFLCNKLNLVERTTGELWLSCLKLITLLK